MLIKLILLSFSQLDTNERNQSNDRPKLIHTANCTRHRSVVLKHFSFQQFGIPIIIWY